MVRNPYFWLSSMVRKPYAVQFPPGAETRDQRLAAPVRFFDRDFDHLLHLWSSYYRAYRNRLGRRAEVIYVRLEDLVADPHAQLDRLQRFARRPDVDWDGTVRATFEAPAKRHREPCVGGYEARRRYTAARVAEELGANNLGSVNGRIDRDLMERLGYPVVETGRGRWISPKVGNASPQQSQDTTKHSGVTAR